MTRNKLFSLAMSAVMLAGLAGCGTGNTSTSSVAPVQGKTIDLVYSGTASDQTFNEGLFEEFKAARKAAGDPNTYNISYEAHGPDKVDSEVLNWKEGPDVYEFASDKIQALYQKGALAKVGGIYKTFIEEELNAFGQGAAMFNGDYYAYPYTGDNTYYLQYDKSVLSADDVKSVEALLDKAASLGKKVGYNLKEAFWGAAAMFTYGADYNMSFDADGNITNVEADFDGEKGIKAAKAIYKIVKHEAWQNAMEAPNATNGLVACIAGTWDVATYKEALGDNYACAVMPTVTVDGDTKNLGAFLGGKLFGVNPQRADEDRLVAAHELAKFLSGKTAQLARFDNAGTAPCHVEAAAEERVQNDKNVAVLSAHGAYAHAQTAVPGNFWSAPAKLVETLLSETFTGTDAEFATACKTMNDAIIASR